MDKVAYIKCVGIAAVRRGKLVECIDPKHRKLAYTLRLELELEDKRAAQFTRFTLPLIRQSYPTSLANTLVSVQPMTTAAAAVYHAKYERKIQPNAILFGDKVYWVQCGSGKLAKRVELDEEGMAEVIAAIREFSDEFQ